MDGNTETTPSGRQIVVEDVDNTFGLGFLELCRDGNLVTLDLKSKNPKRMEFHYPQVRLNLESGIIHTLNGPLEIWVRDNRIEGRVLSHGTLLKTVSLSL